MKILVTGATGFIGSALIKHLEHIQDFLWLGVAKDMELIVKSECSKFPGSMQIYCNYFLLMP